MLEVDTFLTTLYVIADDFFASTIRQKRGPAHSPPSPRAR